MPTCTHVIEAAAAQAHTRHGAGTGARHGAGTGTRHGAGNGAADAFDTITLDETDRRRRRLLLVSDGGTEILLDLPAVRLLRDGDLLVLDDGRLVRVVAEGEALYEVRGHDAHALLTLVWHLGNRHLPTEVREDHVRIRADAVIRTMLLGLGARVSEVRDGFDPEGGAYGGTGTSGQSHPGEREHSGEHEHSDEHGHDHGAHRSRARRV